MQKARKASVKRIETREETSIVFDLVPKALDQMALPVEPGVVVALGRARFFRRPDRNRPLVLDQGEQGIGIVAPIRNQVVKLQIGDQVGGLSDVVTLAAGQTEAQRIAQPIHHDVDFTAEATPTAPPTPGRLDRRFFWAPAAQGWARTIVLSIITLSRSGSAAT